ncbi:pilus assembly protein PilZ [Nostoc sp. 3335mG]|nr:pilus assembly protein PilZ [Nostoc sp. 3335mG]
MATAVSSIESRRAPRDIVSFRAPLDGPASIRTSVLMVDISPFGFMSRCQAPLTPGDIVAVKLPVVGNRAAKIVWSLGGRVGGEFLEAIASDIYGMMLKRAPNDKPAWNEF